MSTYSEMPGGLKNYEVPITEMGGFDEDDNKLKPVDPAHEFRKKGIV